MNSLYIFVLERISQSSSLPNNSPQIQMPIPSNYIPMPDIRQNINDMYRLCQYSFPYFPFVYPQYPYAMPNSTTEENRQAPLNNSKGELNQNQGSFINYVQYPTPQGLFYAAIPGNSMQDPNMSLFSNPVITTPNENPRTVIDNKPNDEAKEKETPSIPQDPKKD